MLSHADQIMKNIMRVNNYDLLHKHLLQLSWRQQVVLQLRFWEEKSIYQVAYIMGISWNEADALLQSAIAKLKQSICASILEATKKQAA